MEIRRHFGIGDSAVSQASRRMEMLLAGDRKLRRRVQKMRRSLALSYVET
ncbi:MAG: hypothetical protein M0Z71_07695 [Nitrospiraceae bacterium]|nr:hypothetical protein [Nitrospiraceae bacterium]